MTEGREQVGSSREEEPTGPVIRDKRRIDPDTGGVRNTTDSEGSSGMTNDKPDLNNQGSAPAGATDAERTVEAEGGDSAFAGAVGDDLPGGTAKTAGADAADLGGEDASAAPVNQTDADYVHPDTLLAAQRLADLQRLQAEYVNYKMRVDRDRDKQQQATVARVVESLMPVMDDIHLARQHGDLEGGPFEKIAEKLQLILERHGFEQFGAEGESFDPAQHEALMHVQAELPADADGPTVVQVMQPGYRVGERIVRPARVSVATPE